MVSKKGQLLIISKNPILSITLTQEVQSCGYTAQFATTLEQATSKANRYKPDMIIIDLDDKGFLTPESLKEFRRLLPRLYILALGSSTTTEMEMTFMNGADSFLLKPFSIISLKAVIDRYLDPQIKKHFRIHQRIVVEKTLIWRPDSSENKREATIMNISCGGLFIHSKTYLPKRQEIISFRLNYNQDELTSVVGKGIVRWISTPGMNHAMQGFGLEFISIDPALYQSINRLALQQNPANQNAPK